MGSKLKAPSPTLEKKGDSLRLHSSERVDCPFFTCELVNLERRYESVPGILFPPTGRSATKLRVRVADPALPLPLQLELVAVIPPLGILDLNHCCVLIPFPGPFQQDDVSSAILHFQLQFPEGSLGQWL